MKITELMDRLNAEKFEGKIRKIMWLVEQSEVSYKWVADSLIVYPDNYSESIETSKYTTLFTTNMDSSSQEEEDRRDLEINFEINFKSEEDLVSLLKAIKEASDTYFSKSSDKVYSIDWEDSSEFIKVVKEKKAKEEEKETYLESLETDSILDHIAELEAVRTLLIRLNDKVTRDNIQKHIDNLNKKVEEGKLLRIEEESIEYGELKSKKVRYLTKAEVKKSFCSIDMDYIFDSKTKSVYTSTWPYSEVERRDNVLHCSVYDNLDNKEITVLKFLD